MGKESWDNRVGEAGLSASVIEVLNEKLGGLLDQFSELPEKIQEEILEKISELKTNAASNPKALVKKARALTGMYWQAWSIGETAIYEAETKTKEKDDNLSDGASRQIITGLENLEERLEAVMKSKPRQGFFIKPPARGKRGGDCYKEIPRETIRGK